KGAAVQFVNENITVDKNGASPMDSLMLGILAAFAEFERRRIKERQAEGIAIARAKGKYAQQPAHSDDEIEQVKAIVELGHPKTEIATQYQVSRQTNYNTLRRKGTKSESKQDHGKSQVYFVADHLPPASQLEVICPQIQLQCGADGVFSRKSNMVKPKASLVLRDLEEKYAPEPVSPKFE